MCDFVSDICVMICCVTTKQNLRMASDSLAQSRVTEFKIKPHKNQLHSQKEKNNNHNGRALSDIHTHACEL